MLNDLCFFFVNPVHVLLVSLLSYVLRWRKGFEEKHTFEAGNREGGNDGVSFSGEFSFP